MTYYLSSLMSDCLLRLGKMTAQQASGGSATSAVVADIAGVDNDGDFTNGYLFVLRTTDGLTPQGKFAKITAYTASTGTFTFATLTDAVGAGDIVGYTSPDDYPVQTLIRLANDALQSIDSLTMVDTSTLTGSTSKTEYDFAIAWKYAPPLRIDIQTNPNDADNNEWVRYYSYEYIPGIGGAVSTIVFRGDVASGYKIRVWYKGRHPYISLYNDPVDEHIHPELAKLMLLDKMLEWKLSIMNGNDDFLLQKWNDIKNQLETAKVMYPIWRPKLGNKILVVA